MTDNEIEKIFKMFQQCTFTNYYIAKKTGLSNATLKNYRENRTKPTIANILTLKHFFDEEYSKKTNNSSKNIIADKISNTTINQITN